MYKQAPLFLLSIMAFKYVAVVGLPALITVYHFNSIPARIEAGPMQFGHGKTTGKTPEILHVFSDYVTEQLNSTVSLNPNLKLRMREGNTAREDILNFCPKSLKAFDQLQHHAFKSDIWRVCILFEMGKEYFLFND